MRVRTAVPTVAGGFVGVLVVAAIWSAVASVNTAARFPVIPAIVQATIDNFSAAPILAYTTFGTGGIWSNVLWTAQNVLLGVATGLIVGFATGLALARIQWFNRLGRLPVAILGTVPVLAILPFLTLWFGNSTLATSGLVIFFTALTVASTVQSAAAAAEVRYADYAATLGVSKSRTTVSVILPALVPSTIGVVRAATAFGWGFQCIAEVLGGNQGAGRLVRSFSDATQTAGAIGVLIVVGIVAVVVDALIGLAGRWIVRWNE
ncbi:ABC transporter permease [Mycolicibacterium baixiangningiae]|uniref:ABC transporter permease n=1 Tax=Mycolicibacterium baixiangningiae TaxID=2761578 RepID=UPI0018674C8C|nr:ABC transporter permease subunit [Mycolicibacterium baixiangningiae]